MGVFAMPMIWSVLMMNVFKCISIGGLCAGAVVAQAGMMGGGGEYRWAVAGDGDWHDAINWDLGGVPGEFDSAELGLFNAYMVRVEGGDGSVGSLRIINPLGELGIWGGRSFTVWNSFVNNGRVVVNAVDDGSEESAVLHFPQGLTLEGIGEVVLSGSGDHASISAGPGVLVTNGESHTISGQGQIEAELINEGLVVADVISEELRLGVHSKTNNGTIKATGQTVLTIDGITVTQGPEGEIVGDGGAIRLSQCTIVGGNISTVGFGYAEIFEAAALDGVTLSGRLTVSERNTLTLKNSFTNNGLLTIRNNGSGKSAVFAENDLVLDGSGRIELIQSFPDGAMIEASEGVVITNAPGHTIRGTGHIRAEIVNNGLITANWHTRSLRIDRKPVLNNARMESIGRSRLKLLGITVTQGPEGEIVGHTFGSGVIIGGGSTIIGGRLYSDEDGYIVVSNSTLDDVLVSGLLIVDTNAALFLKPGTVNDAAIEIRSRGSIHWDEEMVFGGEGSIEMGPFSSFDAPEGVSGAVGSRQRVEGIGVISLDFTNHGTLAPGLGIGTMSAVEPVRLSATSHLEIQVDAVSEDFLNSFSTIELGGTLDVLFEDGFAPAQSWTRTVMEADEITGAFDVVNMPMVSELMVNSVVNTGTELIIGQHCHADMNRDDQVDVTDVFWYLTFFQEQDSIADFTDDGLVNFFDISAFFMAFAAGCP